MGKVLLSLFLSFLSLSCIDDNVTLVKEPGSLTGTVLPLGVSAEVNIKQGEIVLTDKVGIDGKFKIDNVDPGVYTFGASAENFGSFQKDNIKIEDGEGYEIGNIELNIMPYPLLRVNPKDEIVDAFFSRTRVIIEFSKNMDFSTIPNSINIIPEVDNFEIEDHSSFSRNNSYYYLFGNFKAGTEYTISLDTTIQTFWGEKLEFPYSFSFSTEYFKLETFYSDRILGAKDEISLGFNSMLENEFANHITIEPIIALEMQRGYRTIRIRPVNSWIADTIFSLRIDNSLKDAEGNQHYNDSTITFTTPPLQVLRTYPVDQKILFSDLENIIIDMNYLVDETSLLSGDCIAITPSLEFNMEHSIINNYSIITIESANFNENTKYTVTLNTNLRDYWGKNLKEPYSFTFKTK